MPESTEAVFKRGDRVKVRFSGEGVGRIVGALGPFGGGGVLLYRIRYPRERVPGDISKRRPKPRYTQAPEDQIELVAPAPAPPPEAA